MVDADVICLDADYTLIKYKLTEFFELQYKSLAKCVVKLGFSESLLNPPWLGDMNKYFFNGSLADLQTGYILKLAEDNTILRAYYGLDEVSQDQLIEIYGNPPIYNLDHLELVFEKEKHFMFITQFYAGGAFVYISGIELSKRGLLEIGNFANWGEKIYIASNMNYDHSNLEQSEFYPEFFANPEKYLIRQSEEVKEELRNLRNSGKKIVLVTNSCHEYSDVVFQYEYGEGWMDFFDLVVSDAGKPQFYLRDEEFEILDKTHLKRGNHRALMVLIGCQNYIFIGDHYVGDCIAPKSIARWNTAFLMEEIYYEKRIEGVASVSEIEETEIHEIDGEAEHYYEKWGSVFVDKGKRTYWWDHILKHSSVISSNLLGCLKAIHR